MSIEKELLIGIDSYQITDEGTSKSELLKKYYYYKINCIFLV